MYMKIVIYSFVTLFIKISLPVNLPDFPTFPSGNLPALGLFRCLIPCGKEK